MQWTPAWLNMNRTRMSPNVPGDSSNWSRKNTNIIVLQSGGGSKYTRSACVVDNWYQTTRLIKCWLVTWEKGDVWGVQMSFSPLPQNEMEEMVLIQEDSCHDICTGAPQFFAQHFAFINDDHHKSCRYNWYTRSDMPYPVLFGNW